MADNPVNGLMEAFDAFKAANDENIAKRDVVLEEKLTKINASLDRFEDMNKKLVAEESARKALQDQVDDLETRANRKDFGKGGTLPAKEDLEYRAAFNRAIRKPADDRSPDDVAVLNKRKAALIKADDVSAGYLVAPPQMEMGIQEDVLEMNPVRGEVSAVTIGVESYKLVKKTGRGSASRIGEQGTRTNTGDMSFGMQEIKAPEMYARAEISVQMLEDSAYDLEAMLRMDMAEQFAYKEGVEFISGTGVNNQAEGILTNADVANVVSGAATAITSDGLINLYYSLKSAYTANARWWLNRATIGAIRKLKDGEGGYLWTPGIPGSVPNTILGASYVEMPSMPDIGAGTYPVLFGDFRRAYLIVDRVSIQIQPDFLTSADAGLVVFRARRRVGGAVRQAEAVKKLKIAAS